MDNEYDSIYESASNANKDILIRLRIVHEFPYSISLNNPDKSLDPPRLPGNGNSLINSIASRFNRHKSSYRAIVRAATAARTAPKPTRAEEALLPLSVLEG